METQTHTHTNAVSSLSVLTDVHWWGFEEGAQRRNWKNQEKDGWLSIMVVTDVTLSDGTKYEFSLEYVATSPTRPDVKLSDEHVGNEPESDPARAQAKAYALLLAKPAAREALIERRKENEERARDTARH